MEESSGYQIILERGEAKGEVRAHYDLLLDLGRLKFGEPETDQHATIQGIKDLDRLTEVSLRIISAASWDEFLA